MSGLKNTVRRVGNVITGKGYMTSAERRAQTAARITAGKNKLFEQPEMPDPVAVRRRERRKAAERRGARAETVLTDTLGPGGG